MRWFRGPALASLALLFLVTVDQPCVLGADPNLGIPMDPNATSADFNGDLRIDIRDFSQLAWYWQSGEMSVDVAGPQGDGIVDFRDLAVLCGHWLHAAPAPVSITWLGHASVRIAWEDAVIYIDPQKLSLTPHDGTLVLVTHSHGDHYAPADIAKIRGPQMKLLGPADVVQAFGSGQSITPGQTIDVGSVRISAVAAYNLTKANHPKSKNWVGYLVELGGKRVYVAGDTDLTPEMKALAHIDVAFLPAGGTYTMDATEAAEATKYVKPSLAIPYHWGQVVGTLADAQRFAKLAACPVRVMTAGETLSSKDLGKDFSFIAYWKLDERQGDLARDSMGSYDGTLAGGPTWQPSGGRTGGAIQLDGVDDIISTPFVLDPSAGPFSLFAWVQGGAPGQVILAQSGGENWLLADSAEGALETRLRQGKTGRAPGGAPLGSQAVVTGGEWHRVGLTWDGSNRVLYVDSAEVARDTQPSLAGSLGGLNIGADGQLTAGSFWSGLLDDVRLYNRAIQP